MITKQGYLNALLLAILLGLSSQTLAQAGGQVSAVKSGGQITQQAKSMRTPANVEYYYGKVAHWIEKRQQLDQRTPINAPNAPGSSATVASSGGGGGGGSSGGSPNGQSNNRWTKEADGQIIEMPSRIPVYNSLPYVQPPCTMKIPIVRQADMIILDNLPQFEYIPVTTGEVQLYNTIFNNFAVEMFWDPSRWNYLTSAFMQEASISAAAGIARGANDAYQGAMNVVMSGTSTGGGSPVGGGGGGGGGGGAGALINIANEASGVPTSGSNTNKTIPQAVWMVQQMYKWVFVPLAILFLLPGAVITQVKALVTAGFNLRADDASSPFEGILRSVVAIFLIPCTQLIVSYSIDVGNSMAYEVSNWVDLQAIINWGQQLSYNPQNFDNQVLPPQASSSSGGGGANTASAGGTNWTGLASSGNWSALTQAALGMLGNQQGGGNTNVGDGEQILQPSAQATDERLAWGSQSLQTMFNGAMDMFSLAIIVLTAFQLVYMCYLYLLGPLSAAFFAWPTVQGRLFRTVFGNWVNAVIMLALWRFYWMVILAIMTQRLIYVSEKGGGFDLQWEVAVFTCLLGLMFYVPMNPWNFDPAQAYQAATQLGQQMMGGGGGGGDGNGGGGGEDAAGPMAADANDHHQPDPSHQSQPNRERQPADQNQSPEQYYVSAETDTTTDEEAPPLLEADQGPMPQSGERLAYEPADLPPTTETASESNESNELLTYQDPTPQGETTVAMLDGAQAPTSEGTPGETGTRESDSTPVSDVNQPNLVAMEAPPLSGDSGSSGSSGSSDLPSSTGSAPVQPTSVAYAEPPTSGESNDLSNPQSNSHHNMPEEGRV
jgi:hypothetical protein